MAVNPLAEEQDEATALLSRPTVPGDFVRAPVTPEDLWLAFQEGAKVRVELPAGLRPEMMRTIGAMLASSVAGLRRLLQLRAASKRQVDVETTTIRSKNNNPLKFASDDTRAMLGLLKPPVHGFLPGPAAVDDAVDDLESHNLAMMAALRLAVERTLARFDPSELEKRLSSGGLLGALVPMSRKARLWELYLEQQRAIRKEAAEGFEEAFTRAFGEAYERELERLKSKRAG
jgi:FHA domain-containing protein